MPGVGLSVSWAGQARLQSPKSNTSLQAQVIPFFYGDSNCLYQTPREGSPLHQRLCNGRGALVDHRVLI
jgi:hypothetical protein